MSEISHNLMEAVSLHLEGENPAEFGLVAQPSLSVTFSELAEHFYD